MMELFLKQLGFKPEAIQKQINDASANLKKVIDYFDARLSAQDKMLNEILTLLKKETDNGQPAIESGGTGSAGSSGTGQQPEAESGNGNGESGSGAGS